jgi:hypothetical protein
MAGRGAGEREGPPLRGAEPVLASVRRLSALWGGSWRPVPGPALSGQDRLEAYPEAAQGTEAVVMQEAVVAIVVACTACGLCGWIGYLIGKWVGEGRP